MAITRCPYCHAIIDENDKYCNNCGTQLLFPEDEDADEAIPGEKIIDVDTEEKDYSIAEPENEPRKEDLEKDLEDALEEDVEELALEELVDEEGQEDEDEEEKEAPKEKTEEVIVLEEVEKAEKGGRRKRGKAAKVETPIESQSTEKKEEEEESGDIEEDEADEEIEEETDTFDEDEGEEEAGIAEETPAPAAFEPPASAAQTEEAEVEYVTEDKSRIDPDAGKKEAAPGPVTFDTRELEGIGKTVELSKAKVDRFLDEAAEKSASAKPAPPAAPPPAAPAPATREPSGTLPPWASVMKGKPVFAETATPGDTAGRERGETGETAEKEIEIFPRRRPSDSTIGLPERITTQAPLPFEPQAAETEEAEAEEEGEGRLAPPPGPARPAIKPASAGREEARLEAFEVAEEEAPRPPFSFSAFFKSKAFDVLFVGLFWLVGLWLAAHSLDMTLFEVMAAMSGSMLLLYAVFALIYFFLFKFFLGETLGDRLFRQRDNNPENGD